MKVSRIIMGFMLSAVFGLFGAGALAAPPPASNVVCTGCVDSTDIADGGVASVDLANGAVTSTKITDGAVTNGKIAPDSVGSTKIIDGSVSSADVGFNYAGSTTKGGPATDLECSGCVSQTELDFSIPGAPSPPPPGYDSGTNIVWTVGDREMILSETSAFNCPDGRASAAPRKDTWFSVDVPTLNSTNAKAAIIIGHAFAQNRITVDPGDEDITNGITVHVHRDGNTPNYHLNQLAHTKFATGIPRARGDEHSMMIVGLDANKDFYVFYHFGEMQDAGADETDLCFWGLRIQLVGWIE